MSNLRPQKRTVINGASEDVHAVRWVDSVSPACKSDQWNNFHRCRLKLRGEEMRSSTPRRMIRMKRFEFDFDETIAPIQKSKILREFHRPTFKTAMRSGSSDVFNKRNVFPHAPASQLFRLLFTHITIS